MATRDLFSRVSGKWKKLAATDAIPAANIPAASLAAAPTALIDGATITWTLDPTTAQQNATVTLGGSRTLAFSGAVAGMTGMLIVKQDATGSRALTLPSGSKVVNAGAGAIGPTAAANSVDIYSWFYDGTNYFWSYGKNFT